MVDVYCHPPDYYIHLPVLPTSSDHSHCHSPLILSHITFNQIYLYSCMKTIASVFVSDIKCTNHYAGPPSMPVFIPIASFKTLPILIDSPLQNPKTSSPTHLFQIFSRSRRLAFHASKPFTYSCISHHKGYYCCQNTFARSHTLIIASLSGVWKCISLVQPYYRSLASLSVFGSTSVSHLPYPTALSSFGIFITCDQLKHSPSCSLHTLRVSSSP